MSKAIVRRCTVKKVFWKTLQNLQKNTRAGVSFQYEITETPAPVFSWEFCEIFKKTYFVEHLGTVASETDTVLVPWKSFKAILGETVRSSVSYLSILSLYKHDV